MLDLRALIRSRDSVDGGLAPAARPLALHAMVTAAGIQRRTSSAYDWHGLRRGSAEFALLQYTLAGEGRLTVGGAAYRPRPGTAMLLTFPEDNRYWCPDGGRWEFFYLCLAGREVLRAWREAVRRRGPLQELPPDAPFVAAAAGLCRRAVAGGLGSPFAASAAAYDLAMRLLEATAGELPAAPHAERLRAAKAWAGARLAEDLGVADLARAAGLSRFHFTRLFTAAEGLPPAAWLVEQRCQAAARLLRDSSATVAEVGRRCGWRDPAYFCRAFRRVMGVSPGEFRGSGMY